MLFAQFPWVNAETEGYFILRHDMVIWNPHQLSIVILPSIVADSLICECGVFKYIIYSFVYFWSVLRQDYHLFQRYFSRERYLILPLSIPSSPFFLMVIRQVLTSSFSSSRHFQPSFYLPFHYVFYKAVPTQDVTNLGFLSFTLIIQYVIPLLLVRM